MATYLGWSKIKLVPRALIDVSSVDTSVRILKQRLALPVIIAPSSYHVLMHHTAERGTAQVRYMPMLIWLLCCCVGVIQ